MKSASMLDLHVGNRDAVPTGRIPTVKITGEIASSTAVAYRGAGAWGGLKIPPPRNSEGPPKSCHIQPDCENC